MSVEIEAEDWLLVEPYRFGSGSAEFLICRRCGVYIGAVCETAAGTRAVINTNCLDDRAAFTRQPSPVDHDGETTKIGSPAAPPIGRPRPSTADRCWLEKARLLSRNEWLAVRKKARVWSPAARCRPDKRARSCAFTSSIPMT